MGDLHAVHKASWLGVPRGRRLPHQGPLLLYPWDETEVAPGRGFPLSKGGGWDLPHVSIYLLLSVGILDIQASSGALRIIPPRA